MATILYLLALIGTLLTGPSITTLGDEGRENIGDPCDPETYSGPYRCVLNGDGFYTIAQ